mmetsp:Transcript_1510/g.3380  ORF Transcript_1510/g.3380 Transcript_1510/m.3380 type:complete len:121 (-) Transcript_1510:77-439(-)
MDFQDASDEFSIDDVETVIKSAVGSVLTDTEYKPNKVNDWCNSIISAILKGLQSLNRPYKYAVAVVLMQKTGAGLCSAASTWWDASKDGFCKVMWGNGTMQCLVTVYGTHVNVDTPDDDE